MTLLDPDHVAALMSPGIDTDDLLLVIEREQDWLAGDVLAQARIKRARERAALQFAKDRDLGRLEATMARLDAEAASAVVRTSGPRPRTPGARDRGSHVRTD